MLRRVERNSSSSVGPPAEVVRMRLLGANAWATEAADKRKKRNLS